MNGNVKDILDVSCGLCYNEQCRVSHVIFGLPFCIEWIWNIYPDILWQQKRHGGRFI